MGQNISQLNFWEWLSRFSSKGRRNSGGTVPLFLLYFMATLVLKELVPNERKNTSGESIAQQIRNHMEELEGIRENQSSTSTVSKESTIEDIPIVKIQYDAAFDPKGFRSASGLVV
ncbi:hypothetical protein J1N35_028483 [Gossypium stocksii]|uniref:Uncharacterized protein n=1 Tax=Gossypium stocksii TaxID=47602 RepID=A0A9D3UW04_9ROSI|nr:hypothetical protein J1N35_028483 [Gossypium stocksii]